MIPPDSVGNEGEEINLGFKYSSRVELSFSELCTVGNILSFAGAVQVIQQSWIHGCSGNLTSIRGIGGKKRDRLVRLLSDMPDALACELILSPNCAETSS